ncbi:hypothetical protein Taro_042928 [Colocasia esculenta]|uniref:Uncharacterized protein n=1 Tax=Colocasia esculenta TaxID=4460 RepID=A0A843WXR8_COLES|nr:hypothetical protein [Colocasia esculenta]
MLKDQLGRAQNVPRRKGRLNAVIEADLPEEGGMVEGTNSIHSQPGFVLIDTGATYSFISTTFAATLPVKPVPLKSKIIVASPLGSEFELTHYLPKCETIIGGHNLPADLICLDMKGYDAILGVDWLIKYDVDVLFWKGTSVDTTWASVYTQSQPSPEGVLGRSLVSTLPDLVSTLPGQFCPKASVNTTWASVDTLSQMAQKVFWELSLVSTLPDPHGVDTSMGCVDTTFAKYCMFWSEMRARVSWLLMLAMYLVLPSFQRERLEEMGFGEVLRMERMRADAPLTQALRSRWDGEVTAFVFPLGHMIPDLEDGGRITGLRIYSHLGSGFTYPC